MANASQIVIQNAKRALDELDLSTLYEGNAGGLKQLAIGMGFTPDAPLFGPGYVFRNLVPLLNLKIIERKTFNGAGGAITNVFRIETEHGEVTIFVRMDDPVSVAMRGMFPTALGETIAKKVGSPPTVAESFATFVRDSHDTASAQTAPEDTKERVVKLAAEAINELVGGAAANEWKGQVPSKEPRPKPPPLPVNDITVLDAICNLAEEAVSAPEIIKESARRPAGEGPKFMLAYAAYIHWIIERCSANRFKPRNTERIALAVAGRFAKFDWFGPGEYLIIQQAVWESLKNMAPGRYGGCLVPILDVVEGANTAGCKITNNLDAGFMMYTTLVWKECTERIAKLAAES